MIALRGHRSFDEQGRARLIPSGEVVKILVLPIGHEVEQRLFGREEDGYAAIQLVGEGYAARVVIGGWLAVESTERSTDEQKRNSEQRATVGFHGNECTIPYDLKSSGAYRHSIAKKELSS
jgi:hypothetical protein